mgnify:CR=1 FL=1
MVVKRGELYYADLSPVVGSEQGGVRPVLIVQNDTGNKYSPTIIAAAVTSKIGKARLPTHIELPHAFGLAKDSVILLEQIRTLDKRRLLSRIGALPPATMSRVDRAILMCEVPMHQRVIQPGHALALQLRRQIKMRGVILGHDDEPCRVFVDPVHDSRTHHAVDAGKVMAMIKQGIDKRVSLIARSRVHDHAAGLIDDDDIFIFIADIQRDVLRLHIQRLRIIIAEHDLIPRSRFVAALARRTIDRHPALGDQLLHPGTAYAAALAHETIEPDASLRFFYNEFNDHDVPPLRSCTIKTSKMMNTPMHSALSATLNTGKS